MAITEERKKPTYLKDGDAYKASLRDDREVYYQGERIEDVTTHYATAGGINELCEIYDLQFDPVARDVLTYVREDGERVTASYLVPRTKDDLRFRREGIKYVAVGPLHPEHPRREPLHR